MRTRKTITQSALIGIIISQAIIIILLMANWGTQVEIAGWVSSVLIPLLAMAYEVIQHHSLRFFLLTQKLKNWFGGRSVNTFAKLRGRRRLQSWVDHAQAGNVFKNAGQ